MKSEDVRNLWKEGGGREKGGGGGGGIRSTRRVFSARERVRVAQSRQR